MEEKREVNFEETVTPPVEETEDAEELKKEKDTQPESSPSKNQTGETEDESKEEAEESAESKEESEEEPEAVPEPKPVEGESSREKALRLEVQRIRGVLRKERGEKLFSDQKVQSPYSLTPEEEEVLKQYNPDEVQNLEKIIDVIGKKKGWVKKDEFQTSNFQQQSQDILDDWIESSHPEYLPENDKDNILWSSFKESLSMYKIPMNPRGLKKLFDKVHSDVFGIKSGTASSNKINAQKEKIKVASHSGASPSSPKTNRREAPSIDPSLGQHLKGFSEEEKKEILGE